MEQVTGRRPCILGRQQLMCPTWTCPAWLALGFAMIFQLSGLAMEGPLEYQVKAAFLLNFTKFVEWPASAFASADSPIAICVWGDDPFGKILDQIVAEEVVDG